jgi:DNA mismatch endonuclease, patch repair protein
VRAGRKAPSFRGLTPASLAARRAAQGASKKANTKCELILRRGLWAKGFRYRVCAEELPGKPDLVFRRERLAVFCDGDFWHGRDVKSRLARLSVGHNAPYWMTKIRANVVRDRAHTALLELGGWTVIRIWETDIIRNPNKAVALVGNVLRKHRRLG